MMLQSLCQALFDLGWRRGHAAATRSIRAAVAQKKARRRAVEAAARDGLDSPRRPLLSDSAQDELPLLGVDDFDGRPRHGCCKKAGILTGTTMALTALMVSQIFALMFVQAYISQMVFLLAPLLVSFLALALLRTPLPPFFWPTLLLMLLGSAMVVGGKAEAAAGAAASGRNGLGFSKPWQLHVVKVPGSRWGVLMAGENGVASLDDAIGIGLSLLSAFSLAIFMLTIQVCGKVVSNAEVLWANYPTQATLSLALTVALEREKLPVLTELQGWEWAVVFGVSVGVNWMGNLLQQVTIKHLGAPQVAAFLPLRLVGSLIASYLILAEKLDNVWEGAGAGLVLVTLSVYLYVQKRHADQQAITVLMEEAAVEEA